MQSDFDSDLHECAHQCDLSVEARAWDEKIRVEVNISKEQAKERKSVATLFFSAQDITDLNLKYLDAVSKQLDYLRLNAKRQNSMRKYSWEFARLRTKHTKAFSTRNE